MLLQINSTRKNVVIKHIRYNVEQFYRLKTMAPPTDKMTTTSQKNFRRGAKFSRPREAQIWNKVVCQHCCLGYSIHYPLLKILLQRKQGTYEVPAVETGLLGELHPVLLQTHQKAADVKCKRTPPASRLWSSLKRSFEMYILGRPNWIADCAIQGSQTLLCIRGLNSCVFVLCQQIKS